jgi:hypothetical protein
MNAVQKMMSYIIEIYHPPDMKSQTERSQEKCVAQKSKIS